MKKRAIFLDRDGVINEMVHHQEFGIIDSPANPLEFKLLPGVGKALKKLKSLGFLLILISNQPGIAKRKFTLTLHKKINEKMKRNLAQNGVEFDGIYYCLHHPKAKDSKYRKICNCRKPKMGLIEKAEQDFDIDLKNSWFVGDGVDDVLVGNIVGIKMVLLATKKVDILKLLDEKNAKPDFFALDLQEACSIIEKRRMK
ncbi:hypothetical protein A2Z23_01710 [Candidatus Curtissbacteria bacterium RBG_16_39_7]|uniref:D,D-heptose 1,7-bisphosphate phosphatase n=1 Tax=Candidatus Curtissbacteria bacterium RBG_16_39_7 TaxID=1797707 RepID=A0A1F5G514_9BACT|nr:MAG: hypothetical protein A2Z23_01710 [Candidatus Curtissbacteria bacterium RBG_16_39_7]